MKTGTERTIHTPGPWEWDSQHDCIISKHEDWNNSMIAKIATGEDRKQEDANAALISAAPELLEALLGADAALERCAAFVGEDCTNRRGEWDKIKAAIAKARGE